MRSKGQFYRISWIIISLPVDLESYDCKEDASKTCKRLIEAWPTAWDLHVKPKKKRIHSGIYSATVMEVDTWLFNIQGMFAVWA